MRRRVLGILVGLVVGFIVVAVIEGVSSYLHPPPEGFDFNDADAFREFVQSLPVGAFLILLLAHILGSFSAALACAAIVRKRWLAGPLIIGSLLLVAGIVNLTIIPHPIWFAVADVLIYLPSAIAGSRIARAFSR